jgi:hypothetical protein
MRPALDESAEKLQLLGKPLILRGMLVHVNSLSPVARGKGSSR